MPVVKAVDAQGRVQADRLTGGAHFPVRSNDRHLTHPGQALLQRFDARSVYPVVIGDQNAF